MNPESFKSKYLRRSIALPGDHGTWVFLLSPLLIGFFIGGRWTDASPSLIVGVLAAFFLRQPALVAVKAYAGRRSRADLPAARFWMVVYGAVGLIALANLLRHGFAFLLFLAIPGLLVFAWYLWLVIRREERHQIGVDVIASGALALAAPAAYWLTVGRYDLVTGWWLWALTWLQSAASIVYAFLRLEQRRLTERPDRQTKIKMARRALLYTSFNLLVVLLFAAVGILPPFLWLPFALQWVETLWGSLNPAIGLKPTRIGLRQLAVSTLFTIVFILAWNL